MKLMNRALLALAAGTLFALNAHANLLVNPGAETGTLAGWIPGGDAVNPHIDSGSFDSGINPHSGTYDFLGGTGLQFTLTQNVSLSGIANPASATVSFWQQGLNQGATSDNSHVELDFLDFDHALLGSASTAVVDSHGGSWTEGGGTFAIPAGTASIDYVMFFDRAVGSDLDSFMDDNDLTIGGVAAVPEPTNAALLVAGLALIGRLVRRQRRAS
jgi:hypothetical protein